MNTVIYDRSGGYTGYLGNVMFQTAATIGIAIKNKMDYAFTHKHYFDYFKGDIPPLKDITIQAVDYQEPTFHYTDIQLNSNQNYNLKGYFQSWKYWEHCKPLIHKTFTFTDDVKQRVKEKYGNILDLKKIGAELCFVHVRRGDYLQHPNHHPLPTMDYYKYAMIRVEGYMTGSFQCQFVIFSNDINWCKENFKPNDNFYFIEGNDQDVDMCLMSLCDHAIMANSSMSWWGAELIKNKTKVIVAPKKWFGSAYAHWDTKDLYKQQWNLL